MLEQFYRARVELRIASGTTVMMQFEEAVAAAAEAAVDFEAFTARLKAAPFQNEVKPNHHQNACTLVIRV